VSYIEIIFTKVALLFGFQTYFNWHALGTCIYYPKRYFILTKLDLHKIVYKEIPKIFAVIHVRALINNSHNKTNKYTNVTFMFFTHYLS